MSVSKMILCLLSLLSAGHALAGNADLGNPMPPEGPVPEVHAEALELVTPVFRPHFDPPVEVGHPPFDKIPPMPMPEPPEDPQECLPCVPGVPVIHDLSARETYMLPSPSWDGVSLSMPQATSGYAGADGRVDHHDPPLTPLAFKDMSRVSNVWASPWRRNAVLVIRFPSGEFVQCSGTMIDAATALTAGHCIYSHSSGGWATDVWVYPGWDGRGYNIEHDLAEYYGMGRGVRLASWTTWTQQQNFDGDVGVVSLDRAVGMITGWFGNAWDGSFTWIRNQTYNNASYPAEYCGVSGLHTGRDMYYWYGRFDSSTGPDDRQLILHTTGGCFNAGWGGMSGSGAYYISDGKRYVHALASTSNRSTRSWYVKMWGEWATYMNNTFIPVYGRGSMFDLQALQMIVSPTSVPAGGTITSSSHLATNATNASRSGTWTFRIYLSTSPTITPHDTLLGVRSWSESFAAMSAYRVYSGSLTIPANTPPGEYWIGVIYDSGTDSNPSNNDTSGWDAAPITVTVPARGSLRVTIEPGEARNAGARWRLTSGPDTSWKMSGTTLTDIPTGTYTVTFSDISGWTRPANTNVTIFQDHTTTISRTYTRHTGAVRVYTAPSPANDAGARWRLTSGPDTSWKTRGETVSDIPVGTYTITFRSIPGWIKPVDFDVEIVKDQTRAFFRSYLYMLPSAFQVRRETGDVLTPGAFYGSGTHVGGADLAEWVAVSEPVKPGHVLEIDPTASNTYRLARGPCSPTVAGVVSTQPGMILGHTADTEGQALLALLGVVPVKVTDEGGPIATGDLLVVSSTPGHAMRWDPDSVEICGLVGKALEPHEEGESIIEVLLTR